MDTINNAVNTASKAIWGEQNPPTTGNETGAGQEPISGLQGKGSIKEPYDQGNAPNPTTSTGQTGLADSTTTSTGQTGLADSTTTSTGQTGLADSTTTSTGQTGLADSTTASSTGPTTNLKPHESSGPTTSATSEPTTSKFDGPSEAEIPSNPHNAAAGGGPNPLENTKGTGVTGSSAQKLTPSGGDAIPSSASSNPGVAPSSGAAPGGQKQQGADRPLDAPSDPTSAKADDTETILAKRDPNDHSGEPMHMHGGREKPPATQAERRESKIGLEGGQEHGKEHGTGEEWVKTTGVHADGGDFDATKPGAGREADRILEEKGVHRDQKGASDKPEAATTGSEHSEAKVSKMAKIKDKLHIGGNKDK